jgi:hypothetical protein
LTLLIVTLVKLRSFDDAGSASTLRATQISRAPIASSGEA